MLLPLCTFMLRAMGWGGLCCINHLARAKHFTSNLLCAVWTWTWRGRAPTTPASCPRRRAWPRSLPSLRRATPRAPAARCAASRPVSYHCFGLAGRGVLSIQSSRGGWTGAGHYRARARSCRFAGHLCPHSCCGWAPPVPACPTSAPVLACPTSAPASQLAPTLLSPSLHRRRARCRDRRRGPPSQRRRCQPITGTHSLCGRPARRRACSRQHCSQQQRPNCHTGGAGSPRAGGLLWPALSALSARAPLECSLMAELALVIRRVIAATSQVRPACTPNKLASHLFARSLRCLALLLGVCTCTWHC